jgi:hypothetical protein
MGGPTVPPSTCVCLTGRQRAVGLVTIAANCTLRAAFRIPYSVFRILHSAFRILHSALRILHSALRIPPPGIWRAASSAAPRPRPGHASRASWQSSAAHWGPGAAPLARGGVGGARVRPSDGGVRGASARKTRSGVPPQTRRGFGAPAPAKRDPVARPRSGGARGASARKPRSGGPTPNTAGFRGASARKRGLGAPHEPTGRAGAPASLAQQIV